MPAAMLGLMSNCQVDTDVPLEYQSPMETSEHLDENGEEMKKESSIGNSKEINKILEKNFIFCVATLCLYFAFNQVNIEDIYRALSDANLNYILQLL